MDAEVFEVSEEVQLRRIRPGQLLWDLPGDSEVEGINAEEEDDYHSVEEDVFDSDPDEKNALYLSDALLAAEVKDLFFESGAHPSIEREMFEV